LHYSWDSSIERGVNLLTYIDKVMGDQPPKKV